MSVAQDRPIGPNQPVVTPAAEPYEILQRMNAPSFGRRLKNTTLKHTTDVQVQLADRVRGIEKLLMSMPTRADIMVQESREAAAREEVERQVRRSVGTGQNHRT